jgi:hypothetical protein
VRLQELAELLVHMGHVTFVGVLFDLADLDERTCLARLALRQPLVME